MKIALVSLNQQWEDKEYNLNQCELYIKDAATKNVDLIVFPEMTLTGFSLNTTSTGELERKSESVDGFQLLAKSFGIAIVFGVVFKYKDKASNDLIFIDKDGEINAKYTKIHPFSFSGEDKLFNGGVAIGLGRLEGCNIGFTICYDLRFPELYSALGKTSDIVINIANWPKKRIDHWRTLLKARAIENQLFSIGVNRTGRDGNGLEYEESSLVFDANGEPLSPLYNYKDMKVFDVDPEWTKEFRKTFSTTTDRKVTFYKEVL
ncbi:MAG: carbon-nitrogen family hydrolase [Candidatus Scalindua sp.]|jgi:omega-amidase|nr:carbon-nitrogen family hydrolase [Candidatus Scalindua sp.]